jgi:DNA-binding MarR family transcriptional regulator
MASRLPDARDAPVLDPVLDFLRLLWRIEHGLQRTSKRMETTLGVTGPQRLVLKIVRQFPGITAGELAGIVRLHPSTITGVLQRLEAKELLIRERDEHDNRRVHLTVPSHARRLTERSRGTVEAAVEQLFQRMPKEQVRHAREVLSAIADALERPGGDTRALPVPRTARGGSEPKMPPRRVDHPLT